MLGFQAKSLSTTALFGVMVCTFFVCSMGVPPPPPHGPPQSNGQLPHNIQVPMIGRPPSSMSDILNTLQRTQVLLLQMTIRVGQLESRQSLIMKGRDGRDGNDGKEGTRGRDGRDGKDGTKGLSGVNGSPGQPGRDGHDGKDGKPGHKGDPGETGPRGAPGPKGDRSGGVQYVRWGKTACPKTSALVYTGRIGGEFYTTKGGGTNYLCLPNNPKYGNYKDKIQNSGFMFGTEYEVNTFNPFKNKKLHDHDAPCSVCYVNTRNTELMIPATNECPAGWTREYHGYLMTAFRSHHPSEFICVDEDAEAIPGTAKNKNGALLYPVEGRCGALPCKKYPDGRELTCVVCSK